MTTLTQARRALLEIKARADSNLIAGYIDTIGEYLDSQVPLTIEKRIPGQPLTGAEFHTMYGASINHDQETGCLTPDNIVVTVGGHVCQPYDEEPIDLTDLKPMSREDLEKLRETLKSDNITVHGRFVSNRIVKGDADA